MTLDLKTHILTEIDKLFNRYGIRSVTMDDIAKHLGISKKTIYQHFGDKSELILTLMRNKLDLQINIINKGAEYVQNAVHEVWIAIDNLEEMLSNTNPILFFDLLKYYPSSWALFKDFRENFLYEKVLNNLKWGIKEGYYRPEINLEIITRMRIEQIDMAFNQTVFPTHKFSVSQVIRELTDHFLYGICTNSGYHLVRSLKKGA